MRWMIPVVAVVLFVRPAAAQVAGAVRAEPYTLELGEREIETELRRLAVPASRAREDAGTIEIAYVVLPATTEAPGAPIVYLAGGPGGSGISTAGIPYMAELFQRLRGVADVVLLDQRGTGRSIPRLSCGPEGPVPPDVFTTRARMLEFYGAAAASCAARFRAEGVDPSDYQTVESADDLEDLRRALGVERIRLLGFSYGTHLALAAIRRHGERIERAVLAGTEGPGETYKLPSTYDEQLRALAGIAARDPAVGPRVPDLEASLRAVLDRLAREPAVVTVTDRRGENPVDLTIGADGLRYLLRRDIGDTNDLPLFPAWIHEMAHGGTDILAEFAAKRFREIGRGVSLMSIAVDCASGIDPERAARIEAETPGSILGRMTNLLDPEVCEFVEVEDLGAAFREPVESAVPVLFVSGTLDSNTPPRQAEAARAGFAHAAHVVVENAGHESTLPLPEVQTTVARFLAGEEVQDRRIARPPLALVPVEAESADGGGAPGDSALLDALLAGPAETLGAATPIEIPMEIDPSGRPIVTVRIDGRGPYRFGIDWGANIVIVSEEVARETGLPIEGFAPFPGREGRDVARVGDLQIEEVTLRGLRAAVGGFQDTTVDGILGFNAFRDIPITLDFPAARVRLGGAGLSAPDGERTLALVPWTDEDFVGNRPAITIQVGELETTAWLDTRSPLPLVLPATLRDRFTAAGEAQRARARGPQTGDMELEIVPVAEPLVLGTEVVESPLVAFRSLPDSNPEERLFDQVILGGPLLRQFAITLDLAAGAVRFDREATGPIRLPAPRPRPPGR